eukprot:TRINITY_DN4140_c0_g3_i3.p1 TRINITY_DN4140_c0_g3~~TRINITY_DN4140_c0_g3_i3.p1  ORF type:complete len:497 (-),score=169.07 TRINITY_DN4140_c0_g3_i3:241-1731(-)
MSENDEHLYEEEEENISLEERAENLKLKGNEFFSKKEFRKAIEYYSQAIELNATAVYHSNRATAYFHISNYRLSIRDCQAAIRLDKKYKKAYLRLAQCYIASFRILEAKKIINDTIELFPKFREIKEELERVNRLDQLVKKGEELLNNNQSTEALKYFQVAYTLCKASAILILQSKALNQLGDYDRTSKLLFNTVQTESNNSEALSVRGYALYKLGNFNMAKNHFNNALRVDPDHKEARKMLKQIKSLISLKQKGNDAFNESRFEDAYQFYTEAIEIDPENNSYNKILYRNRSAALMKNSNWDEALVDINLSLNIDEDDVKTLKRRAEILKQLDRWDEVVRDLQRILQIDPSNENKKKLRSAKNTLKIKNRKDYYKILGVTKSATDYELKKAKKKMLLKWHPDKHGNKSEEEREKAEEMCKDINEAFSLLSDPKKRQRYDNGEDLSDIEHGPQGFSGGMGGVDISELFNMFGGGMGGMGGMRGNRGGGNHYSSFHF